MHNRRLDHMQELAIANSDSTYILRVHALCYSGAIHDVLCTCVQAVRILEEVFANVGPWVCN